MDWSGLRRDWMNGKYFAGMDKMYIEGQTKLTNYAKLKI